MEKNINAINKIIAELSKRDCEARCRKLTKAQINNIKQGKKTLSDYGGYTLSQETMEAIDLKRDYLSENITEAEYKTWCLAYNRRLVSKDDLGLLEPDGYDKDVVTHQLDEMAEQMPNDIQVSYISCAESPLL